MKENKTMEGTWREKGPPRKTPSPQDEGAEGSSGSVKRPHSDSSTPFQGKQLPKTHRNTQVQTGTFKKDVFSMKMAIIPKRHPDVKLEQNHVEVIQTVCSGQDPLGRDTIAIPVFQIWTETILDYLCK
jgi:hypothetical protein